MGKQNVYDDDTFFNSYKQLRNRVNANELVEIPALFSLLPNVEKKSVLDLGCGYGVHCQKVATLGAKRVLGIDISNKMLEVANKENNNPKVEFKNIAIENLSEIETSFDVIISSLALQYVADFDAVCKQVYRLLNDGGYFVFSQEHPLSTCISSGERWTKDEAGNKLFANISNYSFDGERKTSWFIDGVVKYHRSFSTIINTLVDSGFTIEKMIEPVPSAEVMEKYPNYQDYVHKSEFLLVKVRK